MHSVARNEKAASKQRRARRQQSRPKMMFAGPLFVMRAWRQKGQWESGWIEALLY